MIAVQELTKKFGNNTALDRLSLTMPDNQVCGILGSNGSGKSTLLRTIAGIYTSDSGEVTADGQGVYENIPFKQSLFFVADDPFFYAQSNISDMAGFYRKFYRGWSDETFRHLRQAFPLDVKARISTFSKGMKRQAQLLLGLSCNPRYLLLDEAFDGLDAVMRSLLKKIIADELSRSLQCVVITSHNIAEFENLCDRISIIHQGRKVAEHSSGDFTGQACKVQIAFPGEASGEMFSHLELLSFEKRGRLATLIVRGSAAELLQQLQAMNPQFLDILPLTLEESFRYEMEAAGYGIQNFI